MRAHALRLLVFCATALAFAITAPARAAEGDPPAVSAPSAIVVEASTGAVLYERAADKPRAIASTTKLMTALLTMENADLDDTVSASDYVASPIESRLGLRPGEELSVADLLRGLMLESANDAAVTLAEHVGGTRAAFVRRMNRRARELGLEDTRYQNPIGLDAPGNRSTARDLAALAVELRKFRFIRRLANRTFATLRTGDRERTIRNRNTLLARDERVNGLKTGHTIQAGYVLVGTRTWRGVTLVSVVLGTASPAARDQDSLALLEWGERRFEVVKPVLTGTLVDTPEIRYRRGATLSLVTEGKVKRVVPAGTEITTRDVGVPAMVTGPVQRGQRFGYREVLADGRRIAQVPIVAKSFVPAADLPQRTKDQFTRLPALLLTALVLIGTVLVARRLRRKPRGRPPRSEPEVAA